MTARFQLYDLVLDSEIDFPELDLCDAPASDLMLRYAAENDPVPQSAEWVQSFHAEEDERTWLRIGHHESGFVLEFRDFLTLGVDGEQVTLWPPRNLDDASLRHLLLNQVFPLVVAHAGRIVLHAACVSLKGQAVLLAGPAGIGKSTLAASLLGRGWHITGDDSAVVTRTQAGVTVCAAYPGWRLWPDACEGLGLLDRSKVGVDDGKRQFRPDVEVERQLPLGMICVLAGGRPRRPFLTPLSPRDAVIALVRSTYVLDPRDRTGAVARLDQLAELCRDVPLRELHVPSDFATLDCVGALLEHDLERAATSGS